jgi:hypothetical protein
MTLILYDSMGLAGLFTAIPLYLLYSKHRVPVLRPKKERLRGKESYDVTTYVDKKIQNGERQLPTSFFILYTVRKGENKKANKCMYIVD